LEREFGLTREPLEAKQRRAEEDRLKVYRPHVMRDL